MKEINDEIKLEKFEAFYQWLKEDGLVAKRSERLDILQNSNKRH